MCKRAGMSILPVLAFVSFCHPSLSYGCIDTLYTEQGGEYIRVWPQQPGVDYAVDQLIMKTGVTAIKLPEGATEADLKYCKFNNVELKNALKNAKAYYIKKVFPDASPSDTVAVLDDSTTIRLAILSSIYKVLLLQDSDVYNAIDLLCPLDDVIWAEPNVIMEPHNTPNDEYFDVQWNLKDTGYGIKCESAWNITQGIPEIKIGMVGSGIDLSHPEFAGKIAGGGNYNDQCPGCGYDDDGSGHETRVAGIAAALTNNGNPGGFIAGIAGGWNGGGNDIGAVLYSLRSTGNPGHDHLGDDIARAIYNGVRSPLDCDIINISWGREEYSEVQHAAIAYAQSRRKITVISMGNEGFDGGPPDGPCEPLECRRVYPAQFDNTWIVAVGSYGQDGFRCEDIYRQNCGNHHSSYGGQIDIVAPGYLIPTTSPGGYDPIFGKTSAAAPHATGAAALVLSQKSPLWSEDMDWILKFTADDPGDDGYDEEHGWGRLDAAEAVAKVSYPSFYDIFYYSDDFFYFDSTSSFYVERVWSFYNGDDYDDDDPGPIPDGEYTARRYAVYFTVNYPYPFFPYVGAWGKRHAYENGELVQTKGWSGASPNLQRGYCEVVPDTEIPSGCVIKTYTYHIDRGGYWEWQPFDPDFVQWDPVKLCYAVWGLPAGHGPGGPKAGDTDTDEPIDFSLSSYPNPFNSSVLIKLDLPIPDFVSVDIYNILGRKVKNLIFQRLTADSYDIRWDGTDKNGANIGSGIYLLKIKVGGITRTERMVLIR